MKVIVVIPTHKTNINSVERQNLTQNLHVLGHYDICFVLPDSIEQIPDFPDVPVEHFPKHYFATVNSYNHLMLSEDFYARFQTYDYMLICQTDAYVFRDELQEWSKKGYPYVGAPWLIKQKYQGAGRILLYLRALLHLLAGRRFWLLRYGEHVGNGGLSLRRTQDFLHSCQTDKKEIEQWLHKSHRWHEFNEDCFWSSRPGWNYPTADEALHFCIDHAAKEALQRLRTEMQDPQALPMGVHGYLTRKLNTL